MSERLTLLQWFMFASYLFSSLGASSAELTLHEAAAWGDLERAASILRADPASANVAIGGSDPSGARPLHACGPSKNSLAVARLLLDAKAEVNATNASGYTPLALAIGRKAADLAGLLLDRGADVNQPNMDLRSPLHFAAGGGDEQLVALLIHHRARLDPLDDMGFSPLMYAVAQRDLPVVRMLLDAGAQVDARGSGAGVGTALWLAARCKEEEIARLLLERQADASFAPSSGYSVLHAAAGNGLNRLAALLLLRGANLEGTDSDGATPLHWAAIGPGTRQVSLSANDLDPSVTRRLSGRVAESGCSMEESMAVTKLLVARGARLDVRDKKANTPLHAAAACGNLEVVKYLVSSGIPIGITNGDGNTPLHTACANPHGTYETIRWLISARAPVQALNHERCTPLHLAASCDNANAITMLVEAGADLEVRTLHEKTSLHVGAISGAADSVERLLDFGAQIDSRAANGQTSLHVASGSVPDRPPSPEVLKRLLEHGANPDAQDREGNTPLHIAAFRQSPTCVELLLPHRANPNLANREGITPLHLAAQGPSAASVGLLLQHGARINVQDANGSTPLHLALKAGATSPALELVRNGASLAIADASGFTPLHEAADRGNAKLVEMMLGNGAQLEAKDNFDSTPLHLAAQAEFAPAAHYVAVAKLLLADKANVEARMRLNQTPLHRAAEKGHVEVAAVLLEHGAQVDALADGGATPLHVACFAGKPNMVKLLLEHGAEMDRSASNGLTPLALALKGQQELVVSFLRAKGASLAGPEEPASAGKLAGLGRLAFSGNMTFTEAELRAGLERCVDYLIETHPLAPRSGVVQAVEDHVRRGYLSAGFPDVQVKASLDGTSRHIRVAIEEGQRIKEGEILVQGDAPGPASALMAELTNNVPVEIQEMTTARKRGALRWEARARGPSGSTTNQAEMTLSTTANPMIYLGDWGSFWSGAGQPSFLNTSNYWTQGVLAHAQRLGYFAARLEANLHRRGGEGVADLVVRVIDWGPIGLLDEVRITGNTTNTAGEILEFLAPELGRPATASSIERLERKLWDSGRFVSWHARPELKGGSDDRVVLHLHVEELEVAGLLTREFNEETRVLRKCRDWVADQLGREGEWVCSITVSSNRPWRVPDVRAIFSTRGVAVAFGASSPDTARALPAPLVLVATSNRAGFYSESQQNKLIFAWKEPVLLMGYGHLLPAVSGDDGDGFNLSAGWLGRSSMGDAERRLSDRVVSQIAPAVITDRALATNAVFTRRGGSLILATEGDTWNTTTEVEMTSGRLVMCRVQAPEIGLSMEWSLETRALERHLERCEAVSAGFPNLADPSRPLSATASFLVAEYCSSPLFSKAFPARVSNDQRLALRRVVDGILARDVLRPLDRLASVPLLTWLGGPFPVPPRGSENGRPYAMSVMGGIGMTVARELFAEGTWPEVVAREAGLAMNGAVNYTDQEIDRLYKSKDIGPLGFLAIAALLGQANPEVAGRFAERGLDRLGVAEFKQDYRILAEGNAGLVQAFANLLDALSEMDSARLDAIAAVVSPGTAEFISRSVTTLKSSPKGARAKALEPVLADPWTQFGRPRVEAMLKTVAVSSRRRLEESNPVLLGMRYFDDTRGTPDPVEGVKWFRKAAEKGHAAGQFVLGQCLEQGLGLKADLEEAVAWYRKAAEAGHPEAQARLGYLLSDGISLSRDDVEAYVWLTLASNQSHKLAGALRKSVERRLSPDQLAKAKARVELGAAAVQQPTASERR